MESRTTSHVVTNEENMTNQQDAETIVTIGDIGKFSGTKLGHWHGYQKHDGKLHCMKFSDTDVIPELQHTNAFSVTPTLKNGFQVTS